MDNNQVFQDITNFLSESPEWVKGWLNAPIKKKGPSIDFPDFVVNFFGSLPIESFNTSLKVNRTWYRECMRELAERRKSCIKKYWEAVEDYKEILKEQSGDNFWTKFTISERNQNHDLFYSMETRKRNAFGDWVDVDRACLHCGFPNLIDHDNPGYYIQMWEDEFDPHEIPSPGNDPEGIFDSECGWAYEDDSDA